MKRGSCFECDRSSVSTMTFRPCVFAYLIRSAARECQLIANARRLQEVARKNLIPSSLNAK